jgi:hypothetical protein
MRWAIGAIAAVLGAMAVLPGVASAHHPEYEESVNCEVGTFRSAFDYEGGSGNRILILTVEGDQYDGNSNDFDAAVSGGDPNNSLTASHIDEGSGDGNFNFSDSRDRWESDGAGDRNNFFVLTGDFNDVDGATGDDFDFVMDMYGADDDDDLDDTSIPDSSNDRLDASPGESGDSLIRSMSVSDFNGCVRDICVQLEGNGYVNDSEYDWLVDENGLCKQIGVCESGDIVPENAPQGVTIPGTGDCDPIRVCVDGQNFVVTEFEQQEGDLQTGDCIPYEPPPTPPTTPPTVTTPPAPVQQVAAAVSQVLPTALPATGMGPDETSSSSLGWGAAAVAVLLGVGGLTALMARRQES